VSWLTAFPLPRNKLAVTAGGVTTADTFPVAVGPGSSTLEVMVQGHSVMVSVVDDDTVKVWWLTVMTVGVGQTVTRVETTTVVVETWQLWYFVQLGVLDETAEDETAEEEDEDVVLVG